MVFVILQTVEPRGHLTPMHPTDLAMIQSTVFMLVEVRFMQVTLLVLR